MLRAGAANNGVDEKWLKTRNFVVWDPGDNVKGANSACIYGVVALLLPSSCKNASILLDFMENQAT